MPNTGASDEIDTTSPPPSTSGWVVRSEGAWHWWSGDAGDPEPIGFDALLTMIGSSVTSDGSHEAIPAEPWIGTVVDGAVQVPAGAEVVRLDRVLLQQIDAQVTRPSPVPTPSSAGAQRRWRRRRAEPVELLAPADRSPMRDPALGRQLVEDGFVVVKLLDTEQVEALRTAYGEVHGWVGEGFEPDPANPDVEYRQRAAASIDRVVSEPFERTFDRVRPLLRSYYCKWPDTPETDLHWDWSCVDESSGLRAYQVWIALQDTEGANGQMLVLPQSHRVDARPRGTKLAIPLSAEFQAVEGELRARLTAVPLRAGEAVIFDLGLVHISSPNTTDEARLAATVLICPEEASLAYYRRLTESAALRYDVDERWYNTMIPADLIGEMPDLSPSTVVPLPTSGVDQRVRGLLTPRRR